MTAINDPTAESGLFDVEAPPPVSLADRFAMPPFSVLDRRQGDWQDRRRRWLSLGIESEIGRDQALAFGDAKEGARERNEIIDRMMAINGGTSVFDPVICELAYRWYARPGAAVLDPFAGGSVRGIVAGILGCQYTGVDLRMEQVAANTAQADRMGFAPPLWRPSWLVGDSTRLDDTLDWSAEYDLVFSCPPYADLEVYSDDPRDISTWTYDEFLVGHAQAIASAVEHLRPNRYAVWVIGDVRDQKNGWYRALPMATVKAFEDAGCHLLNEAVIVDPAGTAAVRAARPFQANRKLCRVHQVLYVFVKGNVKAAADWAEGRA